MTDSAEPRGQDPVLEQVGAASLRLLAGSVPPRTMQQLRAQVLADGESYPWREVTDRILAEPVDDTRLLQQGLKAQRDWILRGGSGAGGGRRRKTLKTKGKTLLAYLLSRAIFFTLYTAAVAVLLILLKANWPALDIYKVLDALQDVLPGLFGRR